MGRHTGQKTLRNGSTPTKCRRSPIGTVGLPWTESHRNRRVEALVGSISAQYSLRLQRAEVIRELTKDRIERRMLAMRKAVA